MSGPATGASRLAVTTSNIDGFFCARFAAAELQPPVTLSAGALASEISGKITAIFCSGGNLPANQLVILRVRRVANSSKLPKMSVSPH